MKMMRSCTQGEMVGKSFVQRGQKGNQAWVHQLLVRSGSFKLPLQGGEGRQGISACSRKKQNSNKQIQAGSSRPTLVDNLERREDRNQRTGVEHHHVVSIRTEPEAGSCGEAGKE